MQKASSNLATIIEYVLGGKLPTDARAAEVIQKNAVNWYIEEDGLLYHMWFDNFIVILVVISEHKSNIWYSAPDLAGGAYSAPQAP